MVPAAIAVAAAEPFARMLGGEVRFTVDSAPDGWPKSLVPSPPARVLGGAGYGVAQIVLLDLPEPTDRAMSSFASLLIRAGWWPGKLDPRSQAMQPSTRLYCAESAFMSVTPRDSSAAHTTLEATHILTKGGMFSPGCDSSDHTLIIRADVSIPLLRAPDGAAIVSQAASMSAGSAEFTSTVKSSLAADALLDHYAAQIADKGWALGRRLTAKGAAMQLIERRHESQHWFGIVTVGALGDEYDVGVHVRKISDK